MIRYVLMYEAAVPDCLPNAGSYPGQNQRLQRDLLGCQKGVHLQQAAAGVDVATVWVEDCHGAENGANAVSPVRVLSCL